MIWAEGHTRFPQIRFGRLFAPLTRPVPPDAEMVTAYTDGAVTLRSNRSKEGYHQARDMSAHQGVEPGDLVVHGLDILRGSVGVSDSRGAISSVCTVCTPRFDVDPRFVAHAIRAQAFSGLPRAMARGVREGGADFRRWDTLAELPIPCPAVDEQRAIADYLDRETARIDALVVAKKEIVKLLRERVAAAIQEAIDASGPPTLPLRRLVAAFIDYRGATPEKSSSGIPLITATNVCDGRIDLSAGEQFVSDETYAIWMRRGFPEAGDVLLTTEAPLGEVAAIIDTRVALAQRLILLKPDRTRVTPEFLRISLLSKRVQADLLSRASGSTVWGIRADRLRDVRIPTPALADQRPVTELAQRAERETEPGVTVIDRQLALLREHRQALITAAVTGQIEVPVAA